MARILYSQQLLQFPLLCKLAICMEVGREPHTRKEMPKLRQWSRSWPTWGRTSRWSTSCWLSEIFLQRWISECRWLRCCEHHLEIKFSGGSSSPSKHYEKAHIHLGDLPGVVRKVFDLEKEAHRVGCSKASGFYDYSHLHHSDSFSHLNGKM